MSIVLKCPECGSCDHLMSDGFAEWNQELQVWQLVECYDKDKWCGNPFCTADGEPIKIIEEEQG